MSFEDLWDQVDLVIHHSELRREGVEDLLDLLKSRSALELKYHQGLEKLCNSPKCVSRSGTLAEAVSALKSHWQHRAAKGRALVSLLMSEVVKPLELLLTQQSPLARAQAKEGKILEKALLQKAEKYEKAQFRYHKQSREADKMHLLINNSINFVYKSTDNKMFFAKSLDCANTTDNFFRCLGHSSKSLLGELGLQSDLSTK